SPRSTGAARTSGKSPTPTSSGRQGLRGSHVTARLSVGLRRAFGRASGRAVTRTVTVGAQDGLFHGRIDVGVVIRRGLDAGVPHELLEDVGGHLARIPAAEAAAERAHGQTDAGERGPVDSAPADGLVADLAALAIQEAEDALAHPGQRFQRLLELG